MGGARQDRVAAAATSISDPWGLEVKDTDTELGGTTTDRGNTVPQRANPTQTADVHTNRGGHGQGGTCTNESGADVGRALSEEQRRAARNGRVDDEMLTPTGYPRPNTAADTAHSAHSTQPALRPHRAAPRAEDKPLQTRRPHSVGLCSPLSEGQTQGQCKGSYLEGATPLRRGLRRGPTQNTDRLLGVR